MDKVSLPVGWTRATVAEVGKSVTGNTPSTQNQNNYGAFIPFVKPPQLNDSQIENTKEYLSEQGAKLSRVLPPYSVLVSCIGNLGKTGINRVPVAFNQQINAIIPFEGMSATYLFYQAQSHAFRTQLESKATSTTISIVNKGNFETVVLNISPLNEQHRIVAKIEELFSELDQGIDNLKTAQAQLKVYRQALLKHAFEGKLTAEWRAQNADKLESASALQQRIQHAREQRYQQQLAEWQANGKQGSKPKAPKPITPLTAEELAELPELPEGWCWTKVESLLTLTKKPMATGPFGTLLSKTDHKSNGLPVLGIENIGNGKFIEGNKIFITQEKSLELISFAVESGDLVISRSGTVGEICKIPSGLGKAFISTNLIRITLNSQVMNQDFFVYLFQGGGTVRQQVKELCKGSSRVFLNQTILESLYFPLPTIEEQVSIVSELDNKFSEIDQLDQTITTSLQQAEALRQSILKKAFSGELVPQDPNDEPASALLARIKAEKEAQISQQAKSGKMKP